MSAETSTSSASFNKANTTRHFSLAMTVTLLAGLSAGAVSLRRHRKPRYSPHRKRKRFSRPLLRRRALRPPRPSSLPQLHRNSRPPPHPRSLSQLSPHRPSLRRLNPRRIPRRAPKAPRRSRRRPSNPHRRARRRPRRMKPRPRSSLSAPSPRALNIVRISRTTFPLGHVHGGRLGREGCHDRPCLRISGHVDGLGREVYRACRCAGARRLDAQGHSQGKTLTEATEAVEKKGGPAALMLRMATHEMQLSDAVVEHTDGGGIKERVSSALSRIETHAGRRMSRGTGVLATIGSTAPFVGLFGTVWGIMNSFISISGIADDQPRRCCAGHCRGAARHRHRPCRRYSGRGDLQRLRPLHHRVPPSAGGCRSRCGTPRQPRSRFPPYSPGSTSKPAVSLVGR